MQCKLYLFSVSIPNNYTKLKGFKTHKNETNLHCTRSENLDIGLSFNSDALLKKKKAILTSFVTDETETIIHTLHTHLLDFPPPQYKQWLIENTQLNVIEKCYKLKWKKNEIKMKRNEGEILKQQ